MQNEHINHLYLDTTSQVFGYSEPRPSVFCPRLSNPRLGTSEQGFIFRGEGTQVIRGEFPSMMDLAPPIFPPAGSQSPSPPLSKN